MMTLSPSTLWLMMWSSANPMKIISIKGWLGGNICDYCGAVCPYGICHICNKHE
jgi:hypothetical protein